jgi:hypothetical protein
MTVRTRWKSHVLPLSILAFVLLAAVIGVTKTLSDPEAGAPRGVREGIGELVATSRVCQTFVAQYDGLARVVVKLDDLGRENSGPFTFVLRAGPDADQDLVSLTHDASTVGSHVYHTFAFDALGDSAGQRYIFCLEAPEAGLDNAITAIGTLEDTYSEGQAVFRDMWGARAGVQDLDFSLVYRLSLWKKLAAVGARLAANKPFLWGSGWFYGFLGTVYLALLYRLFQLMPPRGKE